MTGSIGKEVSHREILYRKFSSEGIFVAEVPIVEATVTSSSVQKQ